MKQLVTNRAFVLVMISDVLQNVGIWVRNMALLFFIVTQTNGSPIAVSLLTIVEYLPIFVFSLIGGVLADRWRPKQTMIWGDVLSFLSVLLIIFVVTAGYWQAVFVVTAVSAIVSQFSQPSSLKIIKQHVSEENIPLAMAISQTLMALFIVGGPVLGTAIYNFFDITASLCGLLVIFALSAVCLSFLPPAPVEDLQDDRKSFVSELTEGLRYVRSSEQLKTLLLMYAVLAVGVGLVQPLDVFLVTERLNLPKENLQWFTAVSGFGLLVGGALAGVLSKKVRANVSIFAGLCFLGIATIVEVLSVWPILTGTMRFLTGVFLAFMQTVLSSFMVTTVDEKYIGRLNGLMMPVFTGFLLIGTGVSGVYMTVTSLITVFVTSGIILVAASFIGLRLSVETAADSEPLPYELN